MLIGFSFKNFMSFYEENIFTMHANTDNKYRDFNIIKTKHGRLLKSAFVFGANGSGKTNFIQALLWMNEVVVSDLSMQSKLVSDVPHFQFHNEALNTPTMMEVQFIVGETLYEYGFEILKGEVVKEYLNRKTGQRLTPVFVRNSSDFNDISFTGKEMDNVKDLTKNTRKDNLFLYWANGGNNEIAIEVHRWFESLGFMNMYTENYFPEETISYVQKQGKQKILDLLKQADVNILDFSMDILEEDPSFKKMLKKSVADKLPPVTSLSVETVHHYYDSDWCNPKPISVPFNFESAGTQKLFEIAGFILNALEKGKVIFIDELDSRLHPLLVRYLVMLFNSISKNPNNAQLICNTHDVLLLDEEIRRDQIYFTEKNKYGVTEMYALTDFTGIRKDSKLLRKYLLGLFGAIPNIRAHLTPTPHQEEIDDGKD